MKNRDILNAMGDIDFDMIEDAGRVTRKTSMRRKAARWSSLAACVCLVLALIPMLFKPSSPPTPGDTETPPEEGTSPSPPSNGNHTLPRYEIFEKNGEFYVVFDQATLSESFISQNCQLGSVTFSSVEEFKKTVEEKAFSNSQLLIMYKAFPKNSDGTIKICDVHHLSVPCLPSGLEYGAVGWSGENYSYLLSSFDGIYGNFHCYTDETYQKCYKSEYEEFFLQETIRIRREDWEEERNAEVYYYSTSQGSLKRIRYTLFNEENNETLIIDENYALALNTDLLPVSETVPLSIEIYGGKPGSRFVVYLSNFKERPSVEWLMQFAMKAYEVDDQ